MDDWQLLRDYAIRGDQRAFGELVHRHTNMVMAAAVRQVRDRHLAEDVAQAVFMILARKAASLAPGTIISAWLLTAVRYASANALRMRTRRLLHERKAGEAMRMFRNEWTARSPSQQAEWSDVSPVLDEAMGRLRRSDREALSLRFFEQRSIRDVGRVMGVNEETAKKRVSRAVNRLRELVEPRRFSLPASALAIMLQRNAVESSSPGLACHLTDGALTAECELAATPALEIARSTVALLAWNKIRVVAVALILLLVAAGPTLVNTLMASGPIRTARVVEEPARPALLQQ
jgi:RNA polymerase sigma factor (sigma-70 family)